MKNGITDFIDENSNLAQSVGIKVASITLEELPMAGKVASRLVDPAVWIVTGKTPDSVDIGLYVMGLAGGIVGGASFATGIIKAVVDDDIERKVAQARSCEPEKYRQYIFSCCKYGFAGEFTNAMSVANDGGVSWLHPNGAWVYLNDANSKLVCDYNPRVAKKVFKPLLPLRPTGDGYRWHTAKG